MNQVIAKDSRVIPTPLVIASWVLQVGVAAMLVMAGANKLLGNPMMIGLFDTIGIGQWFRYLTGGLEVTAAVLLLVPRSSGVGAALAAPVMLGAVLTHFLLIGGSALVPFLLLAASVFIAWARRAQLAALVRRVRG